MEGEAVQRHLRRALRLSEPRASNLHLFSPTRGSTTRLPLIIAACMVATAAVAQVPRIKWRPMDFPPATTMEVTIQGEQRDLGPFRIFYEFAKMQNWSCAFDNAGGPRSGSSTLSCQALGKPAWDFYVEHYPDEKRLVFVEGNFAGNPRSGEEVGGMLAIFFKHMR